MKPRYHNLCKNCRLVVQVDGHDMYYCREHPHCHGRDCLVRLGPLDNGAGGWSGRESWSQWVRNGTAHPYYPALSVLVTLGLLDKCELDLMHYEHLVQPKW